MLRLLTAQRRGQPPPRLPARGCQHKPQAIGSPVTTGTRKHLAITLTRAAPRVPPGPAPSREELLRRLHQKLEEARSQRHAEEAAAGGGKAGGGRDAKSPGGKAKEWREKQLGKQAKQPQQQAGAKR